MTRVKGSNIYLARRFADQFAPDAWSRVREVLSSADRALVDSVIASGWYPLTLQHQVFEALEAALPDPEGSRIETFARYVAEHDLTRVHRLFLRFRNPAYTLEKAAEYWSRFYDAGSWKVTRLSPHQARGELTGIAEQAPIFCRFIGAYIVRMFQLAGASVGTSHHTRCVCRGDDRCVFEGTWREEAKPEPRGSLSPNFAPPDEPPG